MAPRISSFDQNPARGGTPAIARVAIPIGVAVTGMILIDSLIAGDTTIFWNAVSHIALPASILGYYSLAYISRMTRSFMLEQMSAEYITTTRVKGMSERQVIWGHAFRNIRVQLITVIALSYANLLEGSVLTEIIFSWPGLGAYVTNAVLSVDFPVIVSVTLIMTVFYIFINLILDLAQAMLDPRVTLQ